MKTKSNYTTPMADIIGLEPLNVIASSSEVNNGINITDPFTYTGDETDL